MVMKGQEDQFLWLRVKGCLLSLDVTCSVSRVQSVGTVFCVLVIGSMHWYMLICLCILQPFPFFYFILYHFLISCLALTL